MSFIGVVEIFRTAQIKQQATFNFTPYLGGGPGVHRRHHPARPADRLADRARPSAGPSAGGDRDDRRRCASRACTSRSGTLEVLRGIDLDVAEHEVVCLIGASGSGKSTLLRCINLLEPIDAGRIFVEGEEITAEGVHLDRLRRRIGIVFQAYNLFPHMSVLDNVTLAPRKALKTPRGAGRAPRRPSCWRASDSPTSATRSRTGCPAVSSSASRSSGRWR